jgi:hypothetical protein
MVLFEEILSFSHLDSIKCGAVTAHQLSLCRMTIDQKVLMNRSLHLTCQVELITQIPKVPGSQ